MASSLVIASDLLRHARLESEARALRESFPEFAAQAWAQIDPNPLQRGWFIDLLWAELERWGRFEPGYERLALAMPPGSSKSLSASVLLQAWMWTRDPSASVLAVASTQDLAVRDTRKMRLLVECPWYRERFWRGWEMAADQNMKQYFENTAKGSRKAMGMNSSKIGWRSDISIVDDIIKYDPGKPPRDEDYDSAYRGMQNVFRTRVNNPLKTRALTIAQRLHEADPIGRLMQEEPERWRAVFFDARFDAAMPHRHPDDPRTEQGEFLLPYLHSEEFLEKTKTTLGSDFYTAQYQQMPAASGGMIVKPSWLQYYGDGEEPGYSYIVISWDCAFKGAETSSWVVGSVWGVEAPADVARRRFVLLDLVREHLDYAETKRAIERLSLRWPTADLTIIEDKANGPAAISELRHRIPTIVGFSPNPYGDKEQRLRSVSPIFEAGKVWLPRSAPWLDEYVAEITKFPKYSTNDQVDSTTQCMLGCVMGLESLLAKTEQNKEVEIFTIDW